MAGLHAFNCKREKPPHARARFFAVLVTTASLLSNSSAGAVADAAATLDAVSV